MHPMTSSRYQRQIILPQWGTKAQNRIQESAVLIIGLGGLGCAVAPYLVSSGIGRIGLVDFDEVSLSNLHRQPLYTADDVGLPKVQQAKKVLKALNPECQIDLYPCAFNVHLDRDLSPALLSQYHCIVDCTDRLSTRYDISRVCHHYQIPHIYGSVDQFEGQVALFPFDGPCYRCMFPVPPPAGTLQNCSQSGVLGPLPGIIGTFQALETLKYLGGLDSAFKSPKLSCFDGFTLQMHSFPLQISPQCECQNSSSVILTPSKSESPLIRLITPRQLKSQSFNPSTSSINLQIIDVRSLQEHQQGSLPSSYLWPLNQIQEACKSTSKSTLIPPALDPKKPTLIYCAQGPRSQKAIALLSPYFSEFYELIGGWNAWCEMNESEHQK